jgi:hypothetical protein
VSLAPAPVIPDPLSTSPTFPAKLARPDMSGIEREILAGNNHNFEFTIEVPTN